MSRDRGALAIVLHTHMPYVEGHGTWPFGEEWLWEAIAGSYVPLLGLLESGAPVTLSLTPVLCDQLEATGVQDRFERFVEEVRSETHARDAAGMREAGHEELASELERAAGDYVRALEEVRARPAGLLAALGGHAAWTSSATHAVLPLLASDACIRLQVQGGADAHRRRFGAWGGGFWLPECAYAPWLLRALEDEGVALTCVELTNALGEGSPEHLRPVLSDEGVVLLPVDRETMALVWSEQGYPAAGAYRDYHHHTVHHHTPWANDGGVYRHEQAVALAREHARDFVQRTLGRLRRAGERAERPLPGGGLVVCALDTELLGHWWYEGVAWLQAVVEEAAAQGLELVRAEEALSRFGPEEPARPAAIALGLAADAQDRARPCSWGAAGDLSTWSGPAVAEMAVQARAAELSVLAAREAAGEAAVRELLGLQASDWAFMVSRGISVPYARERFEGHRERLAQALAGRPDEAALRNLAPAVRAGDLLAP